MIKYFTTLVALSLLPFSGIRFTIASYVADYLTAPQLTACIALDIVLLVPVVLCAICFFPTKH